MPAPRRLDVEQRAAFARDGYLVVPRVAGRAAVDAALQIANHWLDDGFDSSRRDHYHSRSFAPEHIGAPQILALLNGTDASLTDPWLEWPAFP